MPALLASRRLLSDLRPTWPVELATDHPLVKDLVFALLDPIAGYDHVGRKAFSSRGSQGRYACGPAGEAAFFSGAATTTNVTQFSGTATQRTWAIWLLRNGAGGSSFGRAISCGSGSNADERIVWNDTASTLAYSRAFSTTAGLWGVPFPTGVARLVVLTYDGSSTSNDPTFDVNGEPVTPTEHTAPSGTVSALSTAYQIGGFGGSVIGWHGAIGPVLVWNRLLSDGERRSLWDPATRWDLWRARSGKIYFDVGAVVSRQQQWMLLGMGA